MALQLDVVVGECSLRPIVELLNRCAVDQGAVVMSLDTYNSLMETVHLLRSPANAAHLQRSLEQAERGELLAHPLIEADLLDTDLLDTDLLDSDPLDAGS